MGTEFVDERLVWIMRLWMVNIFGAVIIWGDGEPFER
jgi:hypothetical protein